MKVEVKQQEKKEINWNDTQLVIREDTGLIILTNGVHCLGIFSGMVVKQGEHKYKTGHYCNGWNKDVFKLFEGEIVITQ